MSLPADLQKLPPQALDVLRILDGRESGLDTEAILSGTGLSERAFGKAIRRLVTRYYVTMPRDGVYALTKTGRVAVEEIHAYDRVGPGGNVARAVLDDDAGFPPEPPAEVAVAAVAEAAPPAAPAPEFPVPPAARHERRLSLLVPREMVLGMTVTLLAGFDTPPHNTVPLGEPARVVVRVSAPGCDVEPVEHELEVPPDQAIGPIRFRLSPRLNQTARVKVLVHQYTAGDTLELMGGLYFDMYVQEMPTSQSAVIQTLGARIDLLPGPAAP
jgi:hypothetical protein